MIIMKGVLAAAFLSSAVAFSGAAAQEKARQSTKGSEDPNEKECRRMASVPGSRVAARRVCMTKAEWARQDEALRASLRDSQSQPKPTDY